LVVVRSPLSKFLDTRLTLKGYDGLIFYIFSQLLKPKFYSNKSFISGIE